MDISGYRYNDAQCGCAHEFLLPVVSRILDQLTADGVRRRLFDLGCGNGAVANELSRRGFDVTGVDPSIAGIEAGHKHFPHLRLSNASTEDDLAGQFGQFPFLLSLEVIEHVYAPRQFVRRVYDLLEPGGLALISTPYHGYLKDLALAITGKWDTHLTALWDHGHIKFWSVKTLGQLLTETGFVDLHFHRVGRIPALAKSMIAVARKPA